MSAQPSLRPLVNRCRHVVRRSTARLLALPLAVLLATAVISPTSARATSEPTAHRARATQISVEVLPPIHQVGSKPASSSDALAVVTATLTPPRAGRLVTLERTTHRGWTTQATRRTDASGQAKFLVPSSDRRTASYRVVTDSPSGGSNSRSKMVGTDLWGPADFTDEFTSDTLGAGWQHRIQFANPWGGRACSKGSPAAVRAADGVLLLSSMPDPVATSPCPALDTAGNALGDFRYRLNGHVSTQESFDFLYGVAAARMKFQRDPGAHPSFWLQPRGLLEHEPTPWGAEIDVVEWYGRMGNRDRMSSTVHAPVPGGEKRSIGGTIARPGRFLTTGSDTWWHNYHVFSVEWTPTEYVFRIDDHEAWRTNEGISHHPEFLILSMLSSDYELPRLGDSEGAAQTAAVDWVRVWQAGPTPA